jgi:hypothetical protein
LFDDLGVALDLFAGAVDVDEQDRVDVGGVAGVGELLCSAAMRTTATTSSRVPGRSSSPGVPPKPQ